MIPKLQFVGIAYIVEKGIQLDAPPVILGLKFRRAPAAALRAFLRGSAAVLLYASSTERNITPSPCTSIRPSLYGMVSGTERIVFTCARMLFSHRSVATRSGLHQLAPLV